MVLDFQDAISRLFRETPHREAEDLREIGRISEICRRLGEFLTLDDGWDGQGAAAPTPESVRNVRRLLKNLEKPHFRNLSPDSVYPTPYGTVAVEWTSSRGSVSADVGSLRITLVSDPPSDGDRVLDQADLETPEGFRLAVETLKSLINRLD